MCQNTENNGNLREEGRTSHETVEKTKMGARGGGIRDYWKRG